MSTHASLWERLTEASIRYADASDNDPDFMRARDRLRKAAIAYGISTLAGQRAVAKRPRRRVWSEDQLGFWPRASPEPRTAPIRRATIALP